MATKPIPTGIIPVIQSRDCTKHITWLKAVFGAEQTAIYHSKDEKTVMHCVLFINDGYLYLCDSSSSMEEKELTEEEREAESNSFILHVECKDPTLFWKNALANSAIVVQDLKKQFWGAVYGKLRDPFGFVWGLMEGGQCRRPGVIPYLMVKGCEEYLEWAAKALRCAVKDKFMSEQNLVQHSCVELNGGVFYMAEDMSSNDGEMQENAQLTLPHVVCHLNVADPTTTWDWLKENGASSVVNLKVQFWGELYGTVRDMKGFYWSLSKASSTTNATSNMTNNKEGVVKEGGVLPYIVSPDCNKHVAWIEDVLGGEVTEMRHTKTGEVMHCKMTVNGGALMLCDRLDLSQPDKPIPLPTNSASDQDKLYNHKGIILHLNVSDPDNTWKKAMANGGVQIIALKTQFWGKYYGQFQDPFGYRWSIIRATTIS